MSEETVVETTPEPKPEVKPPLRSLLDKFEGSPTKEQIEAWKTKHGDVYVSAFSESEIFILRSLRRNEYRAFQEKLALGQMETTDHEIETVKTCLLWTSVLDLEAKAGTVPTLLEQISQNSNFVPPQLVGQFMAKL